MPDGWFSTDDFAASKPCSKSHARELLRKASELGVYERKEWPNNRGSPMFIYRLKS
jgi:predicted transcriptional regulator